MKAAASWTPSLTELIRRTSVDLPPDVEAALRRAHRGEKRGSRAKWVLGMMLENVDAARRNSSPLCQDTGSLTFYVRAPHGFDVSDVERDVRRAVRLATRRGHLRQNTVESVTGRPIADNVATGAPLVHVAFESRRTIEVGLLMKGGGCENVGRQYSLPDSALGADRDTAGVHRCVLDALVQAQGRGCAPGILGVCIGGDRASGYHHAKRQFLRHLDDRAPDSTLAALEHQVMREARQLGIGPMGLGGTCTLLGVKIGSLSRVPASFFVTVAYMCWSYRRRRVVLGADGRIRSWVGP